MLVGMKEYLTTGKEIYPFAFALEDAYLALLMSDRRSTEGWYQTETVSRPWKHIHPGTLKI